MLAIKKRRVKILIAIFVLVIGSLAALAILHKSQSATKNNVAREVPKSDHQASEEPAYIPINLQPTIDAWVQKYPADYSIAVYDLQSKSMIGQHNSDKALFAASLYKLYVAYLALADFQSGAQNPNDILIAGQTKRQCVDKMIRESDSPCGEAMMAAMGQAKLNQRVSNMDLTNTTFTGIQTSAADSVKILSLIHQSKDLEAENTAFLLDAMLTQEPRYKRGLQTGAPKAKWQTKVGWNLDVNYHDVGIMTLPDGRAFAVAILGQGSGSPAPIADFASTIYSKLTAQQP